MVAHSRIWLTWAACGKVGRMNYWVHFIDDKPVRTYGPYTFTVAKQFARIGSQHGVSRRLITRGARRTDPKVRIYEAGVRTWPVKGSQLGDLLPEEKPRMLDPKGSKRRSAEAMLKNPNILSRMADKVRAADKAIERVLTPKSVVSRKEAVLAKLAQGGYASFPAFERAYNDAFAPLLVPDLEHHELRELWRKDAPRQRSPRGFAEPPQMNPKKGEAWFKKQIDAMVQKNPGSPKLDMAAMRKLAALLAKRPKDLNEKVGKMLEVAFAPAGVPPIVTRAAWKTASAVEDAQVRAVKWVARKVTGRKNPAKLHDPVKMAAFRKFYLDLRQRAAQVHPILAVVGLTLDGSVHDSPRHFAMTGKHKDGSTWVHVAPEILDEPKKVWLGVMMHELAHAFVTMGGAPKKKGYDAIERQADKIAEEIFNTKIYYDERNVEVAGPGVTGTRPRPAGVR